MSLRSSCGFSILIAAVIAFAAGILITVFLPDIIIIVMLTLMLLVLCAALLK